MTLHLIGQLVLVSALWGGPEEANKGGEEIAPAPLQRAHLRLVRLGLPLAVIPFRSSFNLTLRLASTSAERSRAMSLVTSFGSCGPTMVA